MGSDTMSKVIKKDKIYLVQSTYGSYPFNNKQSAEQLNTHLNNYEKIAKQHKATEQTLDKMQKGVIQLQMSLKLAQDDLDKIKKEIDI